MKYLKIIRYQNLLMLAFMQFIFRYGFTSQQNIVLSLSHFQYALLVLSTVCIAAGGFIINNIFDTETDNYNKPEKVIVGKSIKEATAYNMYAIFTIIGVGIGFYLSNVIQKPNFAAIFVVIAGTLYLYASSMKQSLLVGNIIVALLLAFSVIIIGIFDLFPATYDGNQTIMGIIFGILIDYAIFTFILNFIREIVKDLEDVDGDYNEGMSTLPIVFGKKRTTILVFVLSFIPIICILYYVYFYVFLSKLILSTIFCLIFILSPLLYFTTKIIDAKSKKDFNHLSIVLKWILFFGIISIALISFNMKNHA